MDEIGTAADPSGNLGVLDDIDDLDNNAVVCDWADFVATIFPLEDLWK